MDVTASSKECGRSLQVVSASENGTVTIWMLDTSQKVRHWTEAHGKAKLTSLTHDHSETRILTGATDGTIKVESFCEDYFISREEYKDKLQLLRTTCLFSPCVLLHLCYLMFVCSLSIFVITITLLLSSGSI